jgi:hypothetical protein
LALVIRRSGSPYYRYSVESTIPEVSQKAGPLTRGQGRPIRHELRIAQVSQKAVHLTRGQERPIRHAVGLKG